MLLTALLLQAAPVPGELKTFGDWTVGCDNGRACQAVALLPEDGADGAILALHRGPEATATPRIWVTVRTEGSPSPAALLIDGRRFPLRLDPQSQELRVADPADAARALGQATRIEAVVEEGGRRSVPVSARGSAAALLHMDEAQRRLGTTSALVRRGGDAGVPAPPPLPVVAVPATSARPARSISLVRVQRLLGPEFTRCEYAQGVDIETARLDARTSLLLASHPCGNGAYNLFSSAYLVDERGRATPARFDFDSGRIESGMPPGNVLVNAGWDASTRQLSTFAKGRGLGDCGTAQAYAWDGARFRLVEASAMAECRGSTDYITTWRARVMPRRR